MGALIEALFLLFLSIWSIASGQLFGPQPQIPNIIPNRQNPMPNVPGGSNPFMNPNSFYYNMGPLYPFGVGCRMSNGQECKDVKLMDREAQTGRQIDLFTWFPYYGGKFNYTVLSVHGYLAFANVMEDGLDFLIGPDDVANWPQNPDPAMIAVYTCRQKQSSAVPPDQTGVYYRLMFRQDMYQTTNIAQLLNIYQKKTDYINWNGDSFLDQVQYDLTQGMVGAQSFRPDVALVVTWQNMSYYQATSQDELQKTATYQMVFLTDRAGQLSYTMLNYHSLGYAGGDIYGNMKRGRCKALFNGGNQTGLVLVDPVYSKYPNKLYQMSSVPHIVGGRYMFRVDDIVRKGGCSNLTAGTYRMTIYPDIINMLGDVPIQVNGPCYQATGSPPTLNIANYKPSQCIVKSPAIAECRMNQFYNWGAKNVYLDFNNNKAYVGTIYYVPVGLDPFGLSVDSIANWFRNPPPKELTVRWYPGNFTDQNGQIINTLELTLYGYKERNDPNSWKYMNTLNPLCVIATVQNSIQNPLYGNYLMQNSYKITVPLNPQWIGNGQSDMWSYSFGVLKLGVPVQQGGNLNYAQQGQGIWSPPVPLQWLWLGTTNGQNQNPEDQRNYIANIAAKACINWFEDEGTQWNFIRDTETNASCPCTLNQAYADLGRFMPHPRCSQRFRQVGCDTFIGAKECFLSSENVISRFATHYGQVCCYDANGYLMQTTYASVQPNIQKGADLDPLPYNPGFPQRAYELGTYTYYKQYEAPVLSNYFHDVMPYYFCCKWSQNHCQFFYWRRPSSGCQEYRPAGISSVYGAGHFTTFDNVQYTFEGNGTYVLLHKNALQYSKNPTPEVTIQIRMERYPNRFVDFSHRNTYQYALMEPVNASVVTGVAVQETNPPSDRVVVILRKDTRRMKYRTNVLVNDEIRYFDTMKMQRFEGLIMYINDVMEGQSEVYITLLKSRIGLRIRESYAYHIYQQQTFEESFGLLDVTVSIPSEYFVHPDPISQQIDWAHAVEGLVGTYSNNTQDEFINPTSGTPSSAYTSDQQAAQWAKLWQVDGVQFVDMFTLQQKDHSEWPEAQLLNTVYKTAPEMSMEDPFYPLYDNDFQTRYDMCMANPSRYGCPPPAMMVNIPSFCKSLKWCTYDYFLLQQKILADLVTSEYDNGRGIRTDMYAMRNSCAAINVQYPEYLYIEPARGGYLGGDNVLFQCYQNGWLKGDAYYECRDGQWNKGWQPWCRERSLENTLRIVAIIFGILLCLAFLAAVFLCCFCFSKRRREQTNKYQTGEPLPKKPVNPPPPVTEKVMIPTSESNGYNRYPVPAPEYEANLRVKMANGSPSDGSSPSSNRGANVTSV